MPSFNDIINHINKCDVCKADATLTERLDALYWMDDDATIQETNIQNNISTRVTDIHN